MGIVFGIIDMKIESTLDSLLRELSVSSYSINCLILLFLFSFSLVFLINHSYATDKNEFASKVQKFNFVVAGDFGCGDEAKKTIEMMSSKQPELVIALGDLAHFV